MRLNTLYNLLGAFATLVLLCVGLGAQEAPAVFASEQSGHPVPDETVAEGTFEDRAKSVEGDVVIRRDDQGGMTLSFEGFTLTRTPNPHVYLSSKTTVTMGDITKGRPIRETLDGAMWHVGALKKTDGDQQYRLSSSVDLDRHNSIVIWCEKVNVPLAVASLNKQGSGMDGG